MYFDIFLSNIIVEHSSASTHTPNHSSAFERRRKTGDLMVEPTKINIERIIDIKFINEIIKEHSPSFTHTLPCDSWKKGENQGIQCLQFCTYILLIFTHRNWMSERKLPTLLDSLNVGIWLLFSCLSYQIESVSTAPLGILRQCKFLSVFLIILCKIIFSTNTL